MPATRSFFTGDVVYVERLLGIVEFSTSKSWLTVSEAVAALQPKHVVPGHGAPTTLFRAKADMYDYLVRLRKQTGVHIENGGDMIGASKIYRLALKHLEQFDAFAGRNARVVFAETEFE